MKKPDMREFLTLKYNQCGVGNKLLQYWNLRQEAHKCDMPWYVEHDEHVDSLIRINYRNIPQPEVRHYVYGNLLGDRFFSDNYAGEDRLPIDEIFKIQLGFIPALSFTAIIHLRGGDFKYWMNGEGMLDLKYYTDSIDHVIDNVMEQEKKGVHFIVITDDPKHPHTNGIFEHLVKRFVEGVITFTYNTNSQARPLYNDWNSIVRSKYIISSPSTFAITAGMRSNAYIIHSKTWVDKRVSEGDSFWVGLHNGGNDEYRAGAFL